VADGADEVAFGVWCRIDWGAEGFLAFISNLWRDKPAQNPAAA
jgi:hypothetical protein